MFHHANKARPVLKLSKLIADRTVQLMGHTIRLPSTGPARKALK